MELGYVVNCDHVLLGHDLILFNAVFAATPTFDFAQLPTFWQLLVTFAGEVIGLFLVTKAKASKVDWTQTYSMLANKKDLGHSGYLRRC